MESTIDKLANRWIDVCSSKIGVFAEELKKDVFGLQNPPSFYFVTNQSENKIKGSKTAFHRYKVTLKKVIVPAAGTYVFSLANSNTLLSSDQKNPISDIYHFQDKINKVDAEFDLTKKAHECNHAIILNYTFRLVDGDFDIKKLETYPLANPTCVFSISELDI